ncbi:MAG: DUF4838 domain-containing protein [bacterium]
MRILMGILTAVLMCGSAEGKENLDLTGMRDWSIVVSDSAIPSERYAAAEFQSFFKQAVGIELPIVSQSPAPSRNVFIGVSDAMKASSVGFSTDDLGEEGLRIHIQPDAIAIAGGAPRGTLYGVYEFMERYLGIRFLTFDHTYIPAKETWTVPCEEFTHIPPFSFRWSYYRANATHPEFAARLHVNTTTKDEKLGGITHQSLINHSLYRLLPVKEFGKEHPEYFALVDGKRLLDMGGGGPEVCVTNPDAIEIVAQNVIRELDQNPNQKNISVSQNDNDAYCRCERCEAINQREGTPMGSHLAFVNAVAERVEKKYPDVKIGTLAYWYTRKAPKTIRPRKNVQIQLCSIECCTLHPINDPDCSRNQEFCRDMEEWGNICDDIWVWNYNTNFRSYDLPFPNLRVIGPNVKYFLKNNVKGLFMQANANGDAGEFCDLRNYVISRCIWNPTLDSWDLAEEFCELHYGKAAEPILEYLTMIHDNADESGCHPGCFPSPEEVGLRPEISGKALAYFDRALELADDDTVRSRVEKVSICACKAVVETCAQMEYKDGAYVLGMPKEHKGIVNRYVNLCNRYNMSMVSEQGGAAAYIDLISRADGRKFPAERLESSVWRLTVVPEANGRLVEMIYKPANVNLLIPTIQSTLSEPFRIGTLREMGLQGYDSGKPEAFKAETTKNSITLTKDLPDGSMLVRRIGLKPEQPDRVFCETMIIHEGSKPETYQFKVIPHFHAVSSTEDPDIVTAYIKVDGWKPFNQGWNLNNGPSMDLLDRGTGEIAFYNHEAKRGVLLIYNPQYIARPMLWWYPPEEQINLELVTRPVELKNGQVFSFAYQFQYLDKPPM